MDFNFPFTIDIHGNTKEVKEQERHIEQLIQQVLFTSPGERVNLPEFGCNLNQLVFEPVDTEISTTLQLLIQGSLQKWLGNLIKVESVKVESNDTTLTISILYIINMTQKKILNSFENKVL